MKSAIVLLLPLLFSAAACSKHKCDLKNDEEKKAFFTLADMTQGAFSCDVEGASVAAGMVMPDMRCEIGAANCIAKMHAIHAAPDTVKDAAGRYKAFLEKAGYAMTEKPISGKFMNGKPYEGVQMIGKKGADDGITVTVVPFGNDMVETDTMLAAAK